MRILRIALVVLGLSQIGFGVAFLVPGLMFEQLHLRPPAPAWVNWLMAPAGARYVGYGIGMLLARVRPRGTHCGST